MVEPKLDSTAVERSVSEAAPRYAPSACLRCQGHQWIAQHEPLDGAFTWVPCPECCA